MWQQRLLTRKQCHAACCESHPAVCLLGKRGSWQLGWERLIWYENGHNRLFLATTASHDWLNGPHSIQTDLNTMQRQAARHAQECKQQAYLLSV